MTSNGQPIVELHGVEKSYQQGKIEVKALRGLDLTVHPGEFMALIGPSGSGKTTALNIIGGLDKPTAGSVKVEGRDLATMSRGELSRMRRDRIGFVFQAYNLVPVLTAYENAEMVLRLQGMSVGERRDAVMSLLKDVGLEGMCINEKRTLLVPPALGFGAKGLPRRRIPPNAELVYEVTLLSINGDAQPGRTVELPDRGVSGLGGAYDGGGR